MVFAQAYKSTAPKIQGCDISQRKWGLKLWQQAIRVTQHWNPIFTAFFIREKCQISYHLSQIDEVLVKMSKFWKKSVTLGIWILYDMRVDVSMDLLVVFWNDVWSTARRKVLPKVVDIKSGLKTLLNRICLLGYQQCLRLLWPFWIHESVLVTNYKSHISVK